MAKHTFVGDVDVTGQIKSPTVDAAFYNLGAFDTVADNGDGSVTITRQTGYCKVDGNYNWQYSSELSGCFRISGFADTIPYTKNESWSKAADMKANCVVYSPEAFSTNTNMGICEAYGHLNYRVSSVEASASNVDALKTYLQSNPIYLQYKLTTPHSETIIKNRPIYAKEYVNRSLYNLGAFDTYVDNNDGTVTITRQTGYIHLDGSENWRRWYTETKYYLLITEFPNQPATGNKPSLAVCNLGYTYRNIWDGNLSFDLCANPGSSPWNVPAIDFRKDDITSLTDWKNFVRSHPITIEYRISSASGLVRTETLIAKTPLDSKEDANRVLYNLGAFDLYSDEGNNSIKIIRQTGCVDLRTLSWGTVTMGGNRRGFYAPINDIVAVQSSEYGYLKCPNYPTGTGNVVYGGTRGISMWANEAKVAIYDPAYESYTVDQFKGAMSGILLYYKNNVPHVEYVVKNQPLSQLDARGENWIRNEYQKTTNLIQGIHQENTWGCHFRFHVKPYTTYSIRAYALTTDVSNAYVYLCTTDGLGNFFEVSGERYHDKDYATNNKYGYSFTTGNIAEGEYWLYTQFANQASYSAGIKALKIMLNEGPTVLPYQDTHGSIVHEDDARTLLWSAGGGAFNPKGAMDANANLPLAQSVLNFESIWIVYKTWCTNDAAEERKFKVYAIPDTNTRLSIFTFYQGSVVVRNISFNTDGRTAIVSGPQYEQSGAALTQTQFLCVTEIWGSNI